MTNTEKINVEEIYELGRLFCKAFKPELHDSFFYLKNGLRIAGLGEKYYLSYVPIAINPLDCLGEKEGFTIRKIL